MWLRSCCCVHSLPKRERTCCEYGLDELYKAEYVCEDGQSPLTALLGG